MGVVALSLAVALVSACRPSPESPAPESPVPDPRSPIPASDWFVDRAQASGLAFTHVNGMAGGFLYAEVMPPGLALFDYDGDDDLDLFIVQGHALGAAGAPATATAAVSPGARLFRNDLTPGGALTFTDVTVASGIDARGYGMGAAAGDYNNDGCVDLYVTALGTNRLFRNRCDGTFVDATRESRTADPGWSVSAAFVDIDRDGWLDLFVGHYLHYTVAANIVCYALSGQSDYCPPHVYRAQPSHLFRNNRDGTFTDITTAAGMAGEFGPALGVAAADFNRDGWLDIYVTNDGTPNHLWINQRNGTFRNTALLAGAAVSPDGLAKASMGVDAGDFDNDGDEDLFITELASQGADLYVNDGMGVFTDEGGPSGLRIATLPFTGFGTAWLDFDNDGLLDLATMNGAVTHTAEALARQERFALQQRRQLFRNAGAGRFEDVSSRAGAAFAQEEVGRGAAFGDVDNDGDTDIAVANAAGPLRLLLNTVGSRRPWVGLRLRARQGRDALGARVAITRADGTMLWRRARADGSYASASDPRVLAGLGEGQASPRVRVYWPDGSVEEWAQVASGRYTTLAQGSGAPVADAGAGAGAAAAAGRP